ncbi:hypothetical protein [Reyranella sp.]|uniref:hypothetical protein n=1 Tax=Reyranella sp. TaxID=1929291 RepID=UPI003D0CD1D4
MRRASMAGAFGALVTSRTHAQTGGSAIRFDFEAPVAFQPMPTGKGGPVAWSATEDPTAPAGRVALWTKADSVTVFDDLRIRQI